MWCKDIHDAYLVCKAHRCNRERRCRRASGSVCEHKGGRAACGKAKAKGQERTNHDELGNVVLVVDILLDVNCERRAEHWVDEEVAAEVVVWLGMLASGRSARRCHGSWPRRDYLRSSGGWSPTPDFPTHATVHAIYSTTRPAQFAPLNPQAPPFRPSLAEVPSALPPREPSSYPSSQPALLALASDP